jgi:hypothetical protein
MPANHPFPHASGLQRVLSDVLGRNVTVVPGDSMVIEAQTPAVVADYAGDDGSIEAMCVTDLRLSNALGAALTMVPASSVDEAVRNETIDESNLQNLTEIVKVLSQVFNHDDCAALRWSDAHKLPGELPAGASALMNSPKARRDYDVTVEEYGAGKLAVIVN